MYRVASNDASSELNLCVLNPQALGWEVVTSHAKISGSGIISKTDESLRVDSRYSHPVYLDKVFTDHIMVKTIRDGRWDMGYTLTQNSVGRSFLLVIHLDGGSRSNMPIGHADKNLKLIKSKGINVSTSRGYLMFFQILNSDWSLKWDVKCPITEWVDSHYLEVNQKSNAGLSYSNLSELKLPLA